MWPANVNFRCFINALNSNEEYFSHEPALLKEIIDEIEKILVWERHFLNYFNYVQAGKPFKCVSPGFD